MPGFLQPGAPAAPPIEEAPESAPEPPQEVAEVVEAAPTETLATLGNAAEPGLWLRTPLVAVGGPGRVTSVETGRSVDVTLIPIDGPPTAGSRASLATLQALGVPLTAVAALRVDAL